MARKFYTYHEKIPQDDLHIYDGYHDQADAIITKTKEGNVAFHEDNFFYLYKEGLVRKKTVEIIPKEENKKRFIIYNGERGIPPNIAFQLIKAWRRIHREPKTMVAETASDELNALIEGARLMKKSA